MAVGRSQVCSFLLGVVSALSAAVAIFCLKSSSFVWPSNLHRTLLPNTFLTAAGALNNTFSESFEIPHILHQSWINKTIPQHYTAWRQSWVRNHKHWEFKLWTDDDNDALVEQYAPWFLSRYRQFEQPVMRADSVRYLYMYR